MADPVKCISRSGCMDVSKCLKAGCCMRPAIPAPEAISSNQKSVVVRAGEAFVAKFKREPVSASDCAWLNGYVAASGETSASPARDTEPLEDLWELMDHAEENARTGKVTFDGDAWRRMLTVFWSLGGRYHEELLSLGWKPPQVKTNGDVP